MRTRDAAIALLAALGSGGCTEDLTPATLIERTRILAARVTAGGDPEQVFPAPGEEATVDFVVEGFEPDEGLTWRIYACRSAPVRTGTPLCAITALDEDGDEILAPIFPGSGADAFLQEFVQVDERVASPPSVSFTLGDAIAPDGADCFDEDAEDEATFPRAQVLLTGAICGPGTVPVEPPFVAAFRGLADGSVALEDIDFGDPEFFVTRCVSEVDGSQPEEVLVEEESFGFTVDIRLDAPRSPDGAPPPSSQGNRPPSFPSTLPGEQKPFALGQGVDCFPGFDNQDAPALEAALALWPETDATRCDDPSFPPAAFVSAEDDVCIGIRIPSPEEGGDASEIFDPDGDRWCARSDDPDKGDLPLTHEDLLLSHFATAGELARQFSIYEVETEDGAAILDGPFERNPNFVEWSPPDEDEDEIEIPPEGLLVDFTFVLRDGRAGMAVARRKLCVLPPEDDS